MKPNAATIAPGPRAEHVLLESDESAVPDASEARKIQASLRVRSRMRGGALALDIFDYYFLAVSSTRPRAEPKEYVLELRFLAPGAEHQRHIPMRWLQVTLGLLLFSGLAGWWLRSSTGAWWQHPWIAAMILLWAGTLCTAMMCIYRTTERVAFCSRHGRAALIEFVGGLGTFRAFREFESKVTAHVRASLGTRPIAKAQLLRDEMREHVRLKELGVLSEQTYEGCKLRILRQHENDVAAERRRTTGTR